MKENTKQLSSEEKQYRKMTEEPVCRLIMKLGLPTTISMLITNVYNMVDTWFVSRLGTSATGAVGIVFGLMAIIQAFGFMFGQGAGTNISRALGAHKKERARAFSATGFYLALFALVLLRRVQQKRTGTQAPLCREMLGLETKAAAFPELSLMQQWWHRWLGCGISMGVAGWDALWQAADDALQILPESLTAACCAEILGKF